MYPVLLLSLLAMCEPWCAVQRQLPSYALSLGSNPFLGKEDTPFEVLRARVAVDYGPRLIGRKCFMQFIQRR